MPMKLSGTVEMKAKMKNLDERTVKAIVNGVRDFEQTELKEMQRRTPVEFGDLRDSGYFVEPTVQGDRIIGGIGFSDPKAIWVHEDLEAFHAVGQAKFAESVWEESRPHFADRVGASVKEELGL